QLNPPVVAERWKGKVDGRGGRFNAAPLVDVDIGHGAGFDPEGADQPRGLAGHDLPQIGGGGAPLEARFDLPFYHKDSAAAPETQRLADTAWRWRSEEHTSELQS